MKKALTILTLLSLLILLDQQFYAQQDQDDVVRITTNLVQIDAVVTDKEGNPVPNLTAKDFEILQDGKTQKLTNISFVNLTEPRRSQPAAREKTDKNAPVAPPVRVNTVNAGRLITFIVDDGNCFASQLGITAAREGVEKFINQQMQPDDLVAIYQTRAGSSLMQQHTADKNRLLQTARKIRWLPPRNICINAGTGDFFDPARSGSTLRREGQGSFVSGADRNAQARLEDIARDRQVIGSLGVLRYVVNGLAAVPGRKTVFVLSDGLTLIGTDGGASGRALDIARDLTDAATRAAVVFHTIDVRGVGIPSMIGADADLQANIDTDASMNGEIQAARNSQEGTARALQNGMFYLANQTGGRFYQGNNFLDVPINRALGLEKGYYLLAYEPDDDTFKGKQFHQIQVRVKRPDLQVRSRSGFYGVTDESLRPKPRNESSDLYQALVSPVGSANLNLKLQAFYEADSKSSGFVRSLIHLEGRELTFTDEANNMKKAVFDVAAVTLNEKNEVVDEFNKTHTIRFSAESLAAIRQNGLIYTTEIPTKKPGTYNFRIAIRDAASKQIGATGQVIEVPVIEKGKLFLSKLTVEAVKLKNGQPLPPTNLKIENGFAPVDSPSNAAVRRFGGGAALVYSYSVYNAALDKAANQPKLTIQVKLYRNGELILDGQQQPAQLEAQQDWARINDYGYFRLKENSLPGEYALQIIVKDTIKNEIVTQSVDFEVVD